MYGSVSDASCIRLSTLLQVATPSSSEMSDRERYRAPPQPEPPPHRVRAADLYPRLRTHYDEPGLDVPFTPICGEFVQWVGRMADSGIIAMSNYRLHAQPRRRNGPGCVEWWRRLNAAMAPMSSIQETFAAAYAAWAKEQPPSSLERLGFTTKGAWRVTAANAEFKLCPSYPPLLVMLIYNWRAVCRVVAEAERGHGPHEFHPRDLRSSIRGLGQGAASFLERLGFTTKGAWRVTAANAEFKLFRAMRRIPAVVWRHRGNGAVIARSSQPEVGWLGWRSSEDERLLAALGSACGADPGLAPPTNKYYPGADIQFMSMPNIHHVRRSFQQMRALAAEPSDQANWHSNLERTLWLQYVSGIARAAGIVCRAILAARPVLVHCSDGWDRTPQIVAAAQLCYGRTTASGRSKCGRAWLMTKTRSCDNLLNEAEKRTTQRRCNHFESPRPPRDLTSGSSSLERELCPPTIATDVADLTDACVAEGTDAVTPLSDLARVNGRTSSTFDVGDAQRDASLPASRGASHEASPLGSRTIADGDLLNHSVENHRVNGVNGLNEMLNGIEEVSTKFLD
ncbi:Myotubularin, partial [Operophtera brumata]